MLPRNMYDNLVGDMGVFPAVPLGVGGSFDVVVRGPPRQFSPLAAPPSVTGVLGAGNTDNSNDIVDPLCKLNSVVVYKSNPVSAQCAAVKARVFRPLIERGFLAFVYGGVDQGRVIAESAKVDRLVMTGSCHTYDKIVWDGRNKSDPTVEPALAKPVIAELGSVNPYVVVPGDSLWSDAEIDYQAEVLVAYRMLNNGHLCASPQVVVTCRRWPQRDQFLSAVRKNLCNAPATRCFYPGVQAVYAKFAEAAKDESRCDPIDALSFGRDQTPPILETDVWTPESDEPLPLGVREEAFCPVLLEVALDTIADLPSFLPVAVDFCNQRCWGSLTCTTIVDDTTKTRHRGVLDAALDRMHFGVVAVNIPASAANVFPLLGWGAFPGHSPRDIQSGRGLLGNFGCYENFEKVILDARFQNLHQWRLAPNRAHAELRGQRMADLFLHWTYYRVVKFASAHYVGV